MRGSKRKFAHVAHKVFEFVTPHSPRVHMSASLAHMHARVALLRELEKITDFRAKVFAQLPKRIIVVRRCSEKLLCSITRATPRTRLHKGRIGTIIWMVSWGTYRGLKTNRCTLCMQHRHLAYKSLRRHTSKK